jgi:glutaredoxin
MNITVITKPGCIWCERVEDFLTEQGMQFEVRVIEDQDARKEFAEKHNIKTFPQVFVTDTNGKGEHRIGGYTETVVWVMNLPVPDFTVDDL